MLQASGPVQLPAPTQAVSECQALQEGGVKWVKKDMASALHSARHAVVAIES